MKKTGIIPLVLPLGFFCLSVSSLTDATEEGSTTEISGLTYLRKPTESGTDPSTGPGTRSSAGPDIGSTANSVTDSGKSIGGDTSGTSGSSDTRGSLP